jgi:hypothetical protein
MGVVIVIPADEAMPIRSRETDTQPTPPELQAIVGGYIESVPHWNTYSGRRHRDGRQSAGQRRG